MKSSANKIRIRMLVNILPDVIPGTFKLLGGKPGTVLQAGREYEAQSNKNGAISGLCENGEYMGVRPGEFEFVEAPEWVLKIHGKKVANEP